MEWELYTKIVPIPRGESYSRPGSGILEGGDYTRRVQDLWSLKLDNGKTTWDGLKERAEQGWELVSVTPINQAGATVQLLYTFKRPKS